MNRLGPSLDEFTQRLVRRCRLLYEVIQLWLCGGACVNCHDGRAAGYQRDVSTVEGARAIFVNRDGSAPGLICTACITRRIDGGGVATTKAAFARYGRGRLCAMKVTPFQPGAS
jgi:hypothetical protein